MGLPAGPRADHGGGEIAGGWVEWAAGVLTGINAPLDTINEETLWAWSGAESLPRDRMSWNNPLNSSWYMPGAVAMNSIPVWSYASGADGIQATVQTLLNGPGWPAAPPPFYYPVILANLRASIPRAQWQNACPNLGTWGTGCGWLLSTYGPAPGNLPGDDMTPEQEARLDAVSAGVRFIQGALFWSDDPAEQPFDANFLPQIKGFEARLKAAAGNPTLVVDLKPVLDAIANLEGVLKSLTLKAT